MKTRILIGFGITLTLLTVFSTPSYSQELTDQPIIKQAIKQDLNPNVARLALKAYNKAEAQGLSHSHILTVIDYSKPSSEKRMWVFDLDKQKLLYHNVVAHGSGSGDKYATSFSNQDGSHKSSIGLYLTKGTYFGHDGYSLRLDGLEKGFNDHALARAIVMHGASYAAPSFIPKYGRLGRSWGCPAVPLNLVKPIVNTIKNGSLIFVYANSANYLHHSKYLA